MVNPTQRPAVGSYTCRGLVGRERGLGGLVVGGFVGFRGRLSPNGPPSLRLAPGGFYGKGDWLRAQRGAFTLFQLEDAYGIRVREGRARAVEPALLAKRRQGGRERASIERAEGRMPEASVRATRHGLNPSLQKAAV